MSDRKDSKTTVDARAAPALAGGAQALAEALRRAEIVPEPLVRWAAQEHRRTGRALYELLAERAPAAEPAIYRCLAEFLGVEFEPLDGRNLDAELARYLPSHLAIARRVVPLEWREGTLAVATSRPEMLMVDDEVATMVGAPVQMVLSPPSRLNRLIQSFYGLGADTVDELVAANGEADRPIKLVAPAPVAIGGDLDSTQEASVTRFVNQLLIEAVKSRASDIHIEPYEQQLRVRFRIDGQLQEVPVPPAVKQLEQAIISRVKVLSDLDIAEKRLSQDGQLRLLILGRPVDVRVSVLPSIYGESVVLRILDQQAQFRSLTELGMPEQMLARYRHVLELAQGLLLVTGPTGSGKTTTLYASLNYVNRPGRKIITIEDPVEYRLEGITQVQVRESIGLGFSNLLRSIVRHDPDVIMVGEIRDGVTANIALNSAITGHLVLATLHTNDAPTAVTRLASMGAPPYMVASALKVVLAQRLVRLICGHCREPVANVPADLLAEFPDLEGCPVYHGRGCEACRNTGYAGRTGVFEAFVITESIAEMIAEGAGAQVIHDAAVRQGLRPLREAGVELVRAGLTTIDEVYRVTRDVAEPDRAGGAAPADEDGTKDHAR